MDRDDLHNGLKNIRTRNRQIVAEEQGIRELQEAQLSAILRKDHAARLTSDSWRDHVACTRRHIPHISARYDYFISNAAEVELAKRFLNERGIDTCILGNWGRYKKDYEVADSIQKEAEQASEGRRGIDSGYTSEVAEQETRHSSRDKGEISLRNTLSEISNTAPAVNAPSSLRRKRHQSMPNARRNTAVAQADNGIASGGIAKSPASAGLQVPNLSMKLRVRGRLTQEYEDAIALMKTRGGGLDDSDVSYEDENEELESKSQPRLKVNPPKPLRGREDANVGSSAPSPGQKAITLKLSPAKLQQIQTTRPSNARLSTVGSSEVLTPPTRTSTPLPTNHTPKRAVSRPQLPMPAARTPVTWQDQHKSSAFSLKLLEIQRGASGLDNLSERPIEFHQPSISPKRPKLNLPLGIISNTTYDDKHSQPSHRPPQIRRKESASSQEAPPWSPITQRSNSFSRPPSRKEVHLEKPLRYEHPSTNSSDSPSQLNLASEIKSRVPTYQAPLMTQPAMTSYLKPSINENGSPVLASPPANGLSSGNLSDEGTNPGTTPEFPLGSAQDLEPPHNPWKGPSYPRTPTHASTFGVLGPTDPLRTYARNLLKDSPQYGQSSPSRQFIENRPGAVPRSSALAKASDSSPPNINPDEQSVQALLSSFKKKPDTAGRKSGIRAGEASSTASAPTSKTQSLTEEDESLTGGQASSAKKASEAIAAATLALQERTSKKKGKDGKGRPTTYVKSEKQMQKEAANAAARAVGRTESVSRSGSTEGHKTDTKVNVLPQTPKHGSPALQTTSHIGGEFNDGEKVSNIVQVVEIQKLHDLKSTGERKGIHRYDESTVKPLDVVISSKLKPLGAVNSNVQIIANTSTNNDRYEEDGVFETSLLFKNIPTPEGKKVALDRAKSALQSYQAVMSSRRKTSNLALADLASKKKSTPELKTHGSNQESALLDIPAPKPTGAADEDDKVTSMRKTPAKAGDDESHEPPSVSQTTANVEDASDDGEPSTPLKAKKTKKPGPTRESSVLTDESEKKTKPFRGNQYLMADKTPRLNPDGTPVTRKSLATRGQ